MNTIFCSNCGEPNAKESKFCQLCGTKLSLRAMTSSKHKNIKVKDQAPLTPDSEPYPYVISIKKLLALFVFTGGIYQLVWFYKQFRSFKHETNWKVNPTIRAILSDFVAYSLFKRVSVAVNGLDKSKNLKAGWLALFFVSFIAFGLLPPYYFLLALFSVLPLVPVQKAINYFWQKKYGERVVQSRFGIKNAIWSVAALLLFALTLFSIHTAENYSSLFSSASQDSTSPTTTLESASGEKLLHAVNTRRAENNAEALKENAWLCETAKIRLDDIHNVGIHTFNNTAALLRAVDKVTAKFESNPSQNRDTEPEYFVEIYTYEATIEDAIEAWALYPENDFLTSDTYEYGCAVVGNGYGVLTTGYGDAAKARAEYEKDEASFENDNATLLST